MNLSQFDKQAMAEQKKLLIMSQFYSHTTTSQFTPHLILPAAAISIFTSYLLAYRAGLR